MESISRCEGQWCTVFLKKTLASQPLDMKLGSIFYAERVFTVDQHMLRMIPRPT